MSIGVQTSQSEKNTPPGPPPRVGIVAALLNSQSEPPKYLQDLAEAQARVVGASEAGVFVLETQGETPKLRNVALVRQEAGRAQDRETSLSIMEQVATPCAVANRDGVVELTRAGGIDPRFCLATLLRAKDEVIGISAVIVRCMDLEQARQKLSLAQLVAGYIEYYASERNGAASRKASQAMADAMAIVGSIAAGAGFVAAASNLCNEVASKLGATRVSLGWSRDGRRVKIKAISHTEKFDRKQDVVARLEGVMEECFDQDEPVRYDAATNTGSANVARCAEAFCRAEQLGGVWSLPLFTGETTQGVLTIEYPTGHRASPAAEDAIPVAADLVAVTLRDRYENDRLWIVKTWASLKRLSGMVVGPRYMAAKFTIVACAAVVAGLVLYQPMYHVSGSFQLLARDKQAVSIPYDGFIAKVLVRPGQAVEKDQVLLEMRTDLMELRLGEARSAVARQELEAEKYAADASKQSEYKIALAQRDEAQAQARLLEKMIAQSTLRSPFRGRIVAGDPMDSLNKPVEKGQAIFEVAACDPATPGAIGVRAEILVADRDIQFVREGKAGQLATHSFPRDRFDLTVTRIVPASEAHEGANVYKVYADINKPAGWMMPGLAGKARIEHEPKTLLWSWTRSVVDWVRLQFWL